ncbi:LysR family transcriptional regulator [Vibrio profundi]|uniref:LysR family transcriptional regulator n=1 Tax=Vibrio profundi TaxID=1774960 RepID=UPI0037358DE9
MEWTSLCFDWNRTRAFLVTAEEGSLSAAAKALNMSQPTLSRQVSALEQEIGVVLFDRIGHKLELTQSGIELLDIARRLGEAAQDFSLAASGQCQRLEGNVVISVCELDAVYRLPPILAKLRAQEPGISIEVVVTNKVSDLKRREADIAIRNFYPSQPNVIARKVGEESVWLYGSADYLKQYSQVTSLQDMTDIQIIGFGSNAQVIEQLNQQGWTLTNDNFKLNTEFQMMQLSLCKQHLGLIYLIEEAGQAEQLSKAFASMMEPIRFPVWMVCHEELRTNRRIKRVFDFIANELQTSLS